MAAMRCITGRRRHRAMDHLRLVARLARGCYLLTGAGERALQPSARADENRMLDASARSDTLIDGETIRDRRLDFIRGVCLWMVFLDHIPTDVANLITLRNYAFCDAADVFVFISGVAGAIGYGAIARNSGFTAATIRIVRRAWQIYLAQLVLVLVLFAEIVWLGGGLERYTHEMNIGPLLNTPGPAAIWTVILEYHPVNTDVFPAMVLLRLMFPLVLWLMFTRPTAALAASFVIYAICYGLRLNIPTLPRGDWYFNPFTWQLLVVLGAWWALEGVRRFSDVITSRGALVAAFAIVAVSALLVVGHRIHDASDVPPNWLEQMIFPVDKTNLSFSRVVNLVALVIIAERYIQPDASMLRSKLACLAIKCGEYPLELFSLSVLLSFAMHVVLVDVHEAIPMQIALSIAGIVIMTCVGVALSWAASKGRYWKSQTVRSTPS